MPNQKGSLKDRLRSWQMFLRYKREQRKKIKEIKRKKKQLLKEKQILVTGKYYSKPKVFGLTILGLFLGLFEPKTKNKKISSNFKHNDKYLNIDFEITRLESKIKNQELVIEDIKTIEKIDKVLKEKKTEILTPEIEMKYIARLEVIKNNINQKDIKKNIQNGNVENTKNINCAKIKDNNKFENYFTVDKTKEKKTSKKLKYIKNKKSYGIYIPVLEVKELNKNLDKYTKQINSLNNTIKTELEYNNLFDYEFLIKQLKIKIEDILTKYELLKQLPGFDGLNSYSKIKDIDLYEIRKNDKKIKDKISLCNETLYQIEERKQELITIERTKNIKKQETIKKEEKTNDEKVEKKEIKKEEKDNKLMEIEIANKIVYDSLVKEQRKITKLEKMLSKVSVKKRKPTIFYYTKNLVSSIFNLTFSLFPLNLFKNKMLGGLASGIMINNSLRSVKKILKPEVEVSYIYYDLEKEISSTANYLNRMDFLLSDSLNKIEDIRYEIISKYSQDIAYQSSLSSYLDELSKIQSKIEFERNKVLGLHEDLDYVYKKNKQKVLTIERHNSQ